MTTRTAPRATAHTGRLSAQNANKINRILTAEAGSVDLYRTITAGPSGQLRDLMVGRVSYRGDARGEVEILNPRTGERVGFATRTYDREWGACWRIVEESFDGGLYGLGNASSLSVGVDVLNTDRHTALGHHDARRTGGGRFRVSVAGWRWWYSTI